VCAGIILGDKGKSGGAKRAEKEREQYLWKKEELITEQKLLRDPKQKQSGG